jgi:hypothetical protein
MTERIRYQQFCYLKLNLLYYAIAMRNLVFALEILIQIVKKVFKPYASCIPPL